MSLYGDLKQAWVKRCELRDPAPQFTRFTHPLPSFDLPVASALSDPLPKIAIATPCKNAASHLGDYFALVDSFDYPKDHMHLLLLEGDSSDETYTVATDALAARDADYASTTLMKHDLGLTLDGNRTRSQIQRARRSAIATCRNDLLRMALETDAEYVLFIDSDMAVIPPLALRQILAFQAPVMMANCLHFDGMRIFDKNAFRYTRPVSDRLAKGYVLDGIYQPPSGFFRHYPDPLEGDDVELLHSVGGTFLLIRRDVIEAGVDFPEDPYQLHIETEGFALKASAAGFGAFMVPKLIVRHGPN